ncbi:MAG TPA: ABC transporter ATP-binding protein [Planctomycetota bacterium]|nr:ABC transporter ATP-binding protein [Planctomycetota bacterium]
MDALVVERLKKAYVAPDGERLAVVDIGEFRLAGGAQVALKGRSGSGKTTLLNLIAGVLRADEGRIVVAGEEITALPETGRDRVRAERLGYVFQTFNLLQGLTAIENVLLPMMLRGAADRARAEALLERVGMKGRLDYRPRQLSVGQQQRVAVARALANRPALVLADEPTGNLDEQHADEALRLLRDVCRENEAALLVVSHDNRVLGQFERVVDLRELNRA